MWYCDYNIHQSGLRQHVPYMILYLDLLSVAPESHFYMHQLPIEYRAG